jgi:hypothetical protein
MQRVLRSYLNGPSSGGPGAEPCRATPPPVHYLDFLDICGILLGISFTIAKLDAQSRKASDFAHVPGEDFERWREWTASIYRLGSGACFFRVIFHQGWALYLSRQVVTGPAAPLPMRLSALTVDVLFLAALGATFVRAGRARALRRELGIVLSPARPQPPTPEDDATTAKED